MRFSELDIENFKAIKRFAVKDLTDFVLIAGPNGCGKTCVFDAIRLLKSVYGGYHPQEWQQWFGEFQIDMNDREELDKLCRNPKLPMRISASIQLHPNEAQYLTENAEKVYEEQLWLEVTGGRRISGTSIATLDTQHGARIRADAKQRAANLRSTLEDTSEHEVSVSLAPGGRLTTQSNVVIELVFQIYDPKHLGVLEYHSASRAYQRQALGGIDLNIRNFDDQRKQHSLYNWQNKYSNVKSELAVTYLRDLIETEASGRPPVNSIQGTMRELFATFFPEKDYLGVKPVPGGTLSFPIRLKSGETHEIDELSSGEKEVVYGYLRLRNSAPLYSTVLLDEPELHLNPGLLRQMPAFYYKNLGQARNTQLWLVTHSDALLRQAVGNSSYSVFHMTPAGLSATEGIMNQAEQILADDELERAIQGLVGDLATYKPAGKVVILEGGGDSEFDVRALSRLFPDFAKRVNLLSGGDKRKVKNLYELLSVNASSLGMAGRFFAIVDRDADEHSASPVPGGRLFSWDVYHIENYLLIPKFVRLATNIITGSERLSSDDEALHALRDSAKKTLNSLLYSHVRNKVAHALVSSIAINGDPSTEDPFGALQSAIRSSIERVGIAAAELNSAKDYQQDQEAYRQRLHDQLSDGSWTRDFRGRDVLKRFSHDICGSNVNYEVFRNLILDKMGEAEYQPLGMLTVIKAIDGADLL